MKKVEGKLWNIWIKGSNVFILQEVAAQLIQFENPVKSQLRWAEHGGDEELSAELVRL